MKNINLLRMVKIYPQSLFTLVLISLVFLGSKAWSQKYTAEESKVTFFSAAAIEDITANNTKSNPASRTNEAGQAVPSAPPLVSCSS